MKLRERLGSTEFWYRTAVIVLLMWNLAEAEEAQELADAARVNAARALDRAQAAASHAENASSEAEDAARAARNAFVGCQR